MIDALTIDTAATPAARPRATPAPRAGRIVQLPPSVINKIAAGEVIERPASVVKELVENALDAGAARIDVAIARGGYDRIRVVDDGSGMTPEELPLAVASHATSKIRTADDLFRVATLGFRGEALASIAEIARLSIRTRTADSPAAAELIVTGGTSQPIAPCAGPQGTAIDVDELFFNTPVRRKFLKSVQTEAGHVSEAFSRVALAHPQVHFTLRHNDRHVYDLAPSDPWVTRIAQVFGRELAEKLIWVESSDGPTRVWGYVADPSQSRSHPRMQYLFLNGRYVRDRALQHALGEAYRGLLLSGRYPICFLQIDLPPELVDVNVHPTKLEVRFQDGGRLYSQVLAAVRNKFLSTDLTARVAPRSGEASAAAWPVAAEETEISTAVSPPQTTFELGLRRDDAQPLELQPLPFSWPAAKSVARAVSAEELAPQTVAPVVDAVQPTGVALAAGAASSSLRDAASRSPGTSRAIQIHDRYLVAECDEGLLVVDQHALHERILYERLRSDLASGQLESQKLLVPEPVDLAASEAAAVLEAREMLAELGLAVAPFGGDTLLVTAVPSLLVRRLTPTALLRQVAGLLLGGAKSLEARDLGNKVLETMACKAAVKAGDPLTPEEIEALMRDRGLLADTHHCPHGRPSTLVYRCEELDRQFRRT